MTILVTGGAGYIGSHVVLELLSSGHSVVIVDNLCNSSLVSVQRVTDLAGQAPVFLQGDIRDRVLLDRVFAENKIDAVIHLAGLKAVGESTAEPLRYYSNNVQGALVLFQVMSQYGCRKLVFSSSATVYGNPEVLPIPEDAPLQATNPYGQSKLILEHILRDLANSDPSWRIAVLRYFNPIGAHPSSRLGEDPNGTPNNLLPYAVQVALGNLPQLAVFGGDYPTPDGTGVRDYIHVVDLAQGHLCALTFLSEVCRTGVHVYNLGTGRGYSVLQVVRALEVASGQTVPCHIAPRRPGDIAACYADPTKADREIGWKARRGLDEMMVDTWRWVQNNPERFRQAISIHMKTRA